MISARDLLRRLLAERDDLAANMAVLAVDADRHIAGDGGAADDAALVAVIVDGVMLCRAVVPDDDVTRLPAPAHRIFQCGHMALQDVEEPGGVDVVLTDEFLDEV